MGVFEDVVPAARGSRRAGLPGDRGARRGFVPRAARALALGISMLAAGRAQASFHIAHIERILTGIDGSTDVQFVQVEMDAPGQNLVAGTKLLAFAADGSFSHVVLTLPSKSIKGGTGVSFLMASTAFEAATGMAPDYVFSTAGGNALPAQGGMVCWGKPGAGDEDDPNDPDVVDCVSYGNYTGPDNVHTDAPSPVTPFGHGLERVASTGSSADDFACEDPTVPVTNEPDKRGIAASTPCDAPPCGDGVVGEGEECDDGDTVYEAGDACSAACEAFACGVPTSLVASSPTTSDALFVLRAAVLATNCEPAVCDVDASGGVTASDALLILRKAVGQGVALDCAAA